MHSAMFIAQPSADESWDKFSVNAGAKTEKDKNALRLAENVWLLDVRVSPASLGWLISTAERFGVSYGILQFEHEPQWLPGGFDPKTILGQSAG
jgi:hypothetical protein